MKSLLSSHPQCSAFVPSLWISSQNPNTPPLWTDVSLKIESKASTVSFPVLKSSDSSNSKKSNNDKKQTIIALPVRRTLSTEENNQCIQVIMKVLKVDSLKSSFGKSTQAKNHLTW